jgi:hypothetical protein
VPFDPTHDADDIDDRFTSPVCPPGSSPVDRSPSNSGTADAVITRYNPSQALCFEGVPVG